LADRLRALDDEVVWVDEPAASQRHLGPGLALGLGMFAVCLYVGWALAWGWPRALAAVVVLVASLVAIARFWFGSDAERRPGVGGSGVGHDVDEVGPGGVEAAS
jgi:hypothetical protein